MARLREYVILILDAALLLGFRSGDDLVMALANAEDRKARVRRLTEEQGTAFIEVFVSARLETLIARDVKGLYAKAAKGEVAHFTGRDSSFEEPQQADLVLDTEALSIEDAVFEVLEFVRARSGDGTR